jgi:hypothetical protein
LRKNSFLKRVTEGKIREKLQLKGRRGRRRKQLLDDLKEKRGYWELKEEALYHSQRRVRFGWGYRHVVRTEYELKE